MRRVGDLWAELTSWGNIFAAARAAARGKRSRPDVAAFLLGLEGNVAALRRELLDGTYRPGPYTVFAVRDPKPRRISAAPFRDRVVHHALTRVLEPLFERRFTRDSYACRRGYGTHAALRRARHAAERFPFVLKCDVVKFFASIDHEILLSLLARKVKCRRTLDLARVIVAGSNAQEPHDAYFPGDGLFTPFERRRGLPIGNQTSQFFANVYLDRLDHFVRQELRPTDYLRYVDDFLLFGRDGGALVEMRVRIDEFLCSFRLRTHRGKTRVYRCRDGVTFLGFGIFPGHARLVRGNVTRFKRRARALQRGFASGEVAWDAVSARLRAWNAHAAHGDTWRLREQVLGDLVFSRGCGA